MKSFPAIPEHLTAKIYVDQVLSYSVDESSLLKLDPEEKLNLDEQFSIILNSTLTSPQTIIELPTKSYVDSLHEIRKNRRDLSSVFNDQDNECDNNKLNNLDSITVNRDPSLHNEMANKKYIDDSIGKGTLLRFIQTLQNYLKVSVGNDTHILTKHDKIQLTDVTEIRSPNKGLDLLLKWIVYSNDKNNNSKIDKLIKATKTSSPTGQSGETTLPPIGFAFMYIEASNSNHGNKVFVSFERTYFIHISNITFY